MSKQIIERVKVAENDVGDGACAWVVYNGIPGMAKINVTQRHFYIERSKLKHKVRKASIIRPLEELIHFHVGNVVPGNIFIMEQLSPINNDDTMDMLAVDEDGCIETYNGQYVWRLTYWSQNEDDHDQIIIKVTADQKE